MNLYLSLKYLHIISSILLAGTGLGSAFYLFFIHKTKNQAAIAEVIQLVVKADYWFTLPTILIQPATGFAMLQLTNAPINQAWVVAAISLYIFAGCCYTPVFFIQLKMKSLALQARESQQTLQTQYWVYAKYWERLGYPAFISITIIFWLMVFKPN